MVLIATVPSRLSAENQQMLHMLPDTRVRRKIIKKIPLKVSCSLTYKSTGHLKECTEQYRNNLPKTVKMT